MFSVRKLVPVVSWYIGCRNVYASSVSAENYFSFRRLRSSETVLTWRIRGFIETGGNVFTYSCASCEL